MNSGLDKQLDVDFAEGCFLEGDGQGTVNRHGFFDDDVLGPGCDRVFGEVFFGVREGECFRLRVVEDEGDLQSTFHSLARRGTRFRQGYRRPPGDEPAQVQDEERFLDCHPPVRH